MTVLRLARGAVRPGSTTLRASCVVRIVSAASVRIVTTTTGSGWCCRVEGKSCEATLPFFLCCFAANAAYVTREAGRFYFRG